MKTEIQVWIKKFYPRVRVPGDEFCSVGEERPCFAHLIYLLFSYVIWLSLNFPWPGVRGGVGVGEAWPPRPDTSRRFIWIYHILVAPFNSLFLRRKYTCISVRFLLYHKSDSYGIVLSSPTLFSNGCTETLTSVSLFMWWTYKHWHSSRKTHKNSVIKFITF